MEDAQIKHMVDRFLMWRLPKPWNPDNGISYKRPNYMHAPAGHDWPIGTNLFDAAQATAMVRHMVDGLPSGDEPLLARIEARIRGITAWAPGGLASTSLGRLLSDEVIKAIAKEAAAEACGE